MKKLEKAKFEDGGKGKTIKAKKLEDIDYEKTEGKMGCADRLRLILRQPVKIRLRDECT